MGKEILIDPKLKPDRFDFSGDPLTEEDIEALEEEEPKKSLTPDQKRIHWEAYAKKIERQEEVFKKVFEKVFNKQKELVVAEIKRTGQLPPLNDEQTAKRFEPAIELVYESAFEDAV